MLEKFDALVDVWELVESVVLEDEIVDQVVSVDVIFVCVPGFVEVLLIIAMGIVDFGVELIYKEEDETVEETDSTSIVLDDTEVTCIELDADTFVEYSFL